MRCPVDPLHLMRSFLADILFSIVEDASGDNKIWPNFCPQVGMWRMVTQMVYSPICSYH